MDMHLPQAGQLLSAPEVRVIPTWQIGKSPSYELPTVHKASEDWQVRKEKQPG